MRIYYLDNSGFAVIVGGSLLVFDYYHDIGSTLEKGFSRGVVPRDELSRFERVYFFVSHSHFDHYNRMIFSLGRENPNTKFIIDVGIIKPPEEAVRMGIDAEYRDDFLYARRCPSTDIGASFYVEAGGYSLFHAGDLNCWHWHGQATEAEELTNRHNFTEALSYIKRSVAPTMDVAFFPIDTRLEGPYDDGVIEFVREFSPKLLVPMHFQNDFSVPRRFAAKSPVPVFEIARRGDSIEFTK